MKLIKIKMTAKRVKNDKYDFLTWYGKDGYDHKCNFKFRKDVKLPKTNKTGLYMVEVKSDNINPAFETVGDKHYLVYWISAVESMELIDADDED